MDMDVVGKKKGGEILRSKARIGGGYMLGKHEILRRLVLLEHFMMDGMHTCMHTRAVFGLKRLGIR